MLNKIVELIESKESLLKCVQELASIPYFADNKEPPSKVAKQYDHSKFRKKYRPAKEQKKKLKRLRMHHAHGANV